MQRWRIRRRTRPRRRSHGDRRDEQRVDGRTDRQPAWVLAGPPRRQRDRAHDVRRPPPPQRRSRTKRSCRSPPGLPLRIVGPVAAARSGTWRAVARRDVLRALDNYASLLVLLLANFFLFELVDDRR